MKAAQYNKNLPAFLHLKQHEIDESLAGQASMAQNTAVYDEDAARFNRAVNEETLALEALTLNTGADQAFLDHEYLRLAESYLEQGRFKDAYRIHPDERTTTFLHKIWRASEDSADCDCRPLQIAETQEAKRYVVDTSKRLWRIVFDGDAKKRIFIYVCNSCRGVTVEHEAKANI